MKVLEEEQNKHSKEVDEKLNEILDEIRKWKAAKTSKCKEVINSLKLEMKDVKKETTNELQNCKEEIQQLKKPLTQLDQIQQQLAENNSQQEELKKTTAETTKKLFDAISHQTSLIARMEKQLHGSHFQSYSSSRRSSTGSVSSEESHLPPLQEAFQTRQLVGRSQSLRQQRERPFSGIDTRRVQRHRMTRSTVDVTRRSFDSSDVDFENRH